MFLFCKTNEIAVKDATSKLIFSELFNELLYQNYQQVIEAVRRIIFVTFLSAQICFHR